MIIAVDYDGTLANETEINMPLLRYLIRQQRAGNKVILWTCRTGKSLLDAVSNCASHGLTFNAINDNVSEAIHMLKGNPRKIYADIYIDDKAMQP